MRMSSSLNPNRNRSHRARSIVIDPDVSTQLSLLADERGVSADDLANTWLEAVIAVASGEPLSGGQERDLERIVAELTARVSEIERLVSAGGVSRARTAPHLRVPRRDSDGGQHSLHDEIVSILQENGQPMTANEIAAAIRSRDRYKAPRSAKPVSPAAVSSRVANRQYRDLFRRRDRHISLA